MNYTSHMDTEGPEHDWVRPNGTYVPDDVFKRIIEGLLERFDSLWRKLADR